MVVTDPETYSIEKQKQLFNSSLEWVGLDEKSIDLPPLNNDLQEDFNPSLIQQAISGVSYIPCCFCCC